jgi:hypothetical protein
MSAQQSSPSAEVVKRGDRLLAGSLVFVSLRCTLQYIVLPFLLPLLGLRGDLSLSISVAIDLIALATIAYNVRRLWNTSWRWRYLGLAAVMVAFIVFMLYQDARLLLGLPSA